MNPPELFRVTGVCESTADKITKALVASISPQRAVVQPELQLVVKTMRDVACQ